jgi:acyl-CoA synthetase (NDP forming)
LAALRKIVPSFGSPENPADVTAGFFNDMRLFTDALEIVLADPRLDQLSILLASVSGASAGRACEAIAAVAARTDKPLHVSWSGRHAKSPEALEALTEAGVPFITTPPRSSPALRPTSAACCRAGRRRW